MNHGAKFYAYLLSTMIIETIIYSWERKVCYKVFCIHKIKNVHMSHLSAH